MIKLNVGSKFKELVYRNKYRFFTYLAIFILVTSILLILKNPLYDFYYSKIYKHDSPVINVDNDGIPTVDYGYHYNNYVGQVRQPVTVANYAIKYYGEYLNNNLSALIYFNNNLEWLLTNLEYFNYTEHMTNKTLSRWQYDFTIWGLEKPWYSSLAQGLGIEVFAYAYNITEDSLYLQEIEYLVNSFFVEPAEGGIQYHFKTNDSMIWYPEFVKIFDSSYQPLYILNGFLISYLSCFKAYTIVNNTNLLEIFNNGVNTTQEILDFYDTGSWTYYSLGFDEPVYATSFYHNLHVELLEDISLISNNTIIKNYSEKWQTYTVSPIKERSIFPLSTTKIVVGLIILSSEVFLSEAIYRLIKLFMKKRKNKKSQKA